MTEQEKYLDFEEDIENVCERCGKGYKMPDSKFCLDCEIELGLKKDFLAEKTV